MYPSREEFAELIFYISELKHQYSSKIDEQTIKINDQSCIIEELLWQIRELSDKLRQVSQKVFDMEKTWTEPVKKKKDDKIYENQLPPTRHRHLFSRHNSSARLPPVKKNVPRDKTIDDDDNDIYETIEFRDSTHVYTEPVRDYGQLRKINNVKTSARQQIAMVKKKQNTSGIGGMKKSTATRNLQKFSNVEDISKVGDENEPEVMMRLKPKENNPANNSLVADIGVASTPIEDADKFIQQRNASGILINFGCSNSRRKSDL